MEGFDVEAFLRSQAEEVAARVKKPRKVVKLEGQEVEVELPKYVIRSKSAGQCTSKQGFPHGKVQFNQEDQ